MIFRKRAELIELVPPSYEVQAETIKRDYQRDVRNMDRFNKTLAILGSTVALGGLGAVIALGPPRHHNPQPAITKGVDIPRPSSR